VTAIAPVEAGVGASGRHDFEPGSDASTPLRVRWLGRVPYLEALQLQRTLHTRSAGDHLLLLEHPHVYTLGTSGHAEHVLVAPATVGAELVHADRGGDVTYHGPGQLVGYPVVTLPEWRDGRADVVRYVRGMEAALVAGLAELGITAGHVKGYTGVWVGEGATAEKIAAIGVKINGRRTMHGFALNVDPDLSMFDHIVPCGISDRGVTSISRLLGRAVEMREVVDLLVPHLAAHLGGPADHPGAPVRAVERQDVVWRHRPDDLSAFTRAAGDAAARTSRPTRGRVAADAPAPDDGAPDDAAHAVAPPATGVPVRLLGRLAEAGVDEQADRARPPWMKVRVPTGDGIPQLGHLLRDLGLRTVCEEAGCPNLAECWSAGTATFMILGERCTRACGFCLVDTRRPEPLDLDEPARVAEAVVRMGLDVAVITSVARDDLADGGASGFVATIAAIRARTPHVGIEVLIPDCKGDAAALDTLFAARPDVLNHNLETVARLQRAARPSAGYARSLAVLARAADAGLTTKSGIILGLGETADEVRGAITDLRAVGVDILTVGQYLRPTPQHLPVARWWHPDEFAALGAFARALGFAHVEAGPLVRSSYHAAAGMPGARTRTGTPA
jgi:lipoyl synthase